MDTTVHQVEKDHQTVETPFPQIEYDTQLYRSKRQAGEVTYEYDRWDKTFEVQGE